MARSLAVFLLVARLLSADPIDIAQQYGATSQKLIAAALADEDGATGLGTG